MINFNWKIEAILHTNDYENKAKIYAKHKKNEGTIMLAYRELGALFNKYITGGSNKALDFGSGKRGMDIPS